MFTRKLSGQLSRRLYRTSPGSFLTSSLGSFQEARRRLSEAVYVSNALEHIWNIMAKVTCTKYHACASKLSAVFKLLANVSPRPVLARPPEPYS